MINRVIVLLSAYNGEKYISKQISSILAQRNVDLTLIIRDDGSSDNTKSIIKILCKKYHNVKLIEGKNIGFIKSFSELINYALHEYREELCYYAFSDQDDIWLPEKLYNACKALNGMDRNIPVLYCCNSYLIDKDDKIFGMFHKAPIYLTKGNVIIYPPFQGCSMVFNYKAANIYNNDNPTFTYHDLWMFFICNFMGKIAVDCKPGFKYRIYDGNVHGIGVKGKKGLGKFLFRINRLLFDKRTSDGYITTQYFYKIFERQLPKESRNVILRYLNYKKSLLNKIKMIFDNDFKPTEHDTTKRLLEIIHILQGRV